MEASRFDQVLDCRVVGDERVGRVARHRPDAVGAAAVVDVQGVVEVVGLVG